MLFGHIVSHVVRDPRDGQTLVAGARTGHLGLPVRSSPLASTPSRPTCLPSDGYTVLVQPGPTPAVFSLGRRCAEEPAGARADPQGAVRPARGAGDGGEVES
jgi:hypothetical protein